MTAAVLQIDRLRVKRGDDLGDPEFWNKRLANIDSRIAGLEVRDRNLGAATDELVQRGLLRLDEVVKPLVDDLRASADLGAILFASSSSPVTVGTGEKLFVIDEDDRGAFAPAVDLVIAEVDGSRVMTGRRVSYDKLSGFLIVDVTDTSGSGSASSWEISIGSRGLIADDVTRAETAADAAEVAQAAAEDAAGEALASKDLAETAKTAAEAAQAAAADHLAGVEASAYYFLGPQAADPTTAPGGGPLVAGMEYFNTTSDVRKQYNGSAWAAIYLPADAAVSSFNGRTGAVVPQAGDYTASLITRTSGTGGVSGADVEAALAALKTAIDGKAATSHSHATSDITGLDGALAGKAAAVHSHAMSDITGLVDALAGKASTSHAHTSTQITRSASGSISALTVEGALQELDTEKAPVSHGHAISDVSGLDTALAGKASASHTHTAADLPVATAAQVRAGTASRVLTSDGVYSAAARVAVNATQVGAGIDFSTGINFDVDLTGAAGAITIAAPTNQKVGQSGTIRFINGEGRTLAYNAAWKFAGGVAPSALTVTAARTDVLSYVVLAENVILGTWFLDARAVA